jgi:hypothetical protein
MEIAVGRAEQVCPCKAQGITPGGTQGRELKDGRFFRKVLWRKVFQQIGLCGGSGYWQPWGR